ncbi:MAG: trehalose-6-phosphate synthase, partial [bacterium]
NRQPYVHVHQKGQIACRRGAGGVITALDPVMKACGGMWVAFGNGDADRKVSDQDGKIRVPPDNPEYTLKRVWLTKDEEVGYYYGYSNESLWPLCHTVFNRPAFRKEDWDYYVKVNEKFADAILKEIGDSKAFVWIQDYHLCLLPKMLKERASNQLITAHFWHIPWPGYEAFRICPQGREILDGLLANDLIGFHIRYHCNNFLDVIAREIECKIDRERYSIVRGGHETLIRPYPISVDFEGIDQLATSPQVKALQESLLQELNISGLKILTGLDRIDYTKGIPERLLAVDRLFEHHPELKEKVVFVQMGHLSRIHIEKYKYLNDEINALVERINWKHSTDGWHPIVMVRRHLSLEEALALYRIADACIVSSLQDGMNLVAKEFVSSRSDSQGVLVLSQFTGASRELTDAVLINPYDRDQFGEALYHAIMLPPDERQRRMERMRAVVRRNNIFRWAGKIMSELLKFEFNE